MNRPEIQRTGTVVTAALLLITVLCSTARGQAIQGGWSPPEVRYGSVYVVPDASGTNVLVGFSWNISQTATLKRPRTVWKNTDWQRDMTTRATMMAGGLDIAVLNTNADAVFFPGIAECPISVFAAQGHWILTTLHHVYDIDSTNAVAIFSTAGADSTIWDAKLTEQNLSFEVYRGWTATLMTLDIGKGTASERGNRQITRSQSTIPYKVGASPSDSDSRILEPVTKHFRECHLGKAGKDNLHAPQSIEWGECTTKHSTLRR